MPARTEVRHRSACKRNIRPHVRAVRARSRDWSSLRDKCLALVVVAGLVADAEAGLGAGDRYAAYDRFGQRPRLLPLVRLTRPPRAMAQFAVAEFSQIANQKP